MEEWKDICMNYRVSNLGNVMGPRGLLTPQPSRSNGGGCYYRVKVNGKYCAIHRLVAEQFVANPNDFRYIDHIDRNTQNNKASNLRWVTASQNMLNTSDRTDTRNIYKTASGKYSIQLRRNYKMVFTATKDTLEEAIQIRNQMSQALDNGTPQTEQTLHQE